MAGRASIRAAAVVVALGASACRFDPAASGTGSGDAGPGSDGGVDGGAGPADSGGAGSALHLLLTEVKTHPIEVEFI